MKRFMLNKKTRAIFPYEPDTILGNDDMIECNELGVPIGRPDVQIDQTDAKIAEIESKLAAALQRCFVLESKCEMLEKEKKELLKQIEQNSSMPADMRRKELETLSVKQLRDICDDLGIFNGGNKTELIERIVQSEFSAADEVQSD